MLHYSEILMVRKILLVLVLILSSILEISFLQMVNAKASDVPQLSPPEDTEDVGKWVCQNFPKFCETEPTLQPAPQPAPQASPEKEHNGESGQEGKSPVKSHDK